MAVTTPCYCTREDTQRALDFKDGQLSNARIDRAIQSAARNIEGHLHRTFYPLDTTKYFTWPNYQYAYPWRIWFDRHDCVALTSLQSPSGTAIPLNQVFLEPVNKKPGFPFRYMELDRSTSAAWGAAATPQHSVVAVGTWGFTADTDAAGTLAANVLAADAAITVSDGSQMGVGDLIFLGAGTGVAPFPTYPGTAGAVVPVTGERLLVSDRTAVTTGLTQSGAGCTTASLSDQLLATTGAGTLNTGEVLLLDSEQMLITQVVAGVATVTRAWNGTTLATHSAATVNAYRSLTVLRGQLGTTAAGFSSGAAVARWRGPALVRDLNIAEAAERILQEPSGYARTVGGADVARPAPGTALADLWDEALTTYGRKARLGVA